MRAFLIGVYRDVEGALVSLRRARPFLGITLSVYQRVSWITAAIFATGCLAEQPELIVQQGHSLSVTSLAASGKWLFTGSDDGSVKMWDITKHVLVRNLPSGGGEVKAIACAEAGNLLAYGDKDGRLNLVYLRPNNPIKVLQGHNSQISALAFSPDEKLLVSGDRRGNVLLWRPGRSDSPALVRSGPGWISSLAFSPDGTRLAIGSGSINGQDYLEVRDLEGKVPPRQLHGHSGFTTDAAFSVDGKLLASAGTDGSIYLWDTRTWQGHALDSPHAGGATSINFDPGGRWVISGGKDGLKLRSLPSGSVVRIWKTSDIGVTSARFSRSGDQIYIASGNNVSIWSDPADSTVHVTALNYSSPFFPLTSLVFSPESSTLVTTTNDGARIWDLREGSVTEGFQDAFLAPRVVGDRVGKYLVSAEDYGNLRVRALPSAKFIRTIANPLGPFDLTDIAISPDGKYVVALTRPTSLKIWEVETGRLLSTISVPNHLWGSVDIGPTGIVAVSAAGHTSLVDPIGDAASIDFPEWTKAVHFSPDGSVLATIAVDGNIQLYDVKSRSAMLTLKVQNQTLEKLVFSRSGALLAATDQSGRVFLFSTRLKRQLANFLAHGARVRGLDFSADDRRLVSASEDSTVRIWDIQNPEAPRLMGTMLSPQQFHWLAVAPDGLFDGTSAAMNLVNWRFSDNSVMRLDALYNEYFHPRLVSELLGDRPPKASTDLVALARVAGLRFMITNGDARIETRADKHVLCLRHRPTAAGLQVYKEGVSLPADQDSYIEDSKGPADCRFWREIPDAALVSNTGQAPLMPTAPYEGERVSTADQTLHVFTVGVDSPGLPYSTLPYSASDAVAVRDLIATAGRPHFGAVRVWESLTNFQASRLNVMKRLHDIAIDTQPGDVVFLFFSGHGAIAPEETMFYFLTFPFFPGQLTPDFELSAAQLAESIRWMNSRRIFLVMDACQSGGVLESISKVAQVKLQSDLNSPPGAISQTKAAFYLIASATPLQAAQQSSAGHSMLVKALLSIMPAHHVLTARELADQLALDVANPTRQSGGYPQTPVVVEAGADFVFVGEGGTAPEQRK